MTETPRQCGDCSLCCKLMRIAELDKPKDQWCPNFAAGIGCSIYPDRPPSCRAFICRWLINPTLGPEWKPNLCKMVVDLKANMLVVHADPAANKPWRAEPYHSFLKQMSVKGLKSGDLVMVMERGRSIIILPDRELDLGVLDPDARIQLRQERTAQGMQWQARVMGPAERTPRA